MIRQIPRRYAWLLLVLLLAACERSTKANQIAEFSTESAKTAAVITPSPTPIPATPTPAITHTPTLVPLPGMDQVTTDTTVVFVSETIPDGTVFNPGEAFTKSWILQNGGEATWTKGYRLAVTSTDPEDQRLGAPGFLPLPREVKAGEEITIDVVLLAPNREGDYTVIWQLLNDRDEWVFGSELWAMIKVGKKSQATATPVPGQASQVNSVTVAGITAELKGAGMQQEETTLDFCMEFADERAWYPWDVTLTSSQQSFTPSGSIIDPATATTPTKCFAFSFTTGEKASPGASFKLSIGNVGLPPEVNLEENCEYARQVLRVAYPGLDFKCGKANFFYTDLELPTGMSKEEADKLIMDLMSSTIYGPWALSGTIP